MSKLRLEEIKVENYRSLVDANFDINEQLTALIGINGSGKTNALSAIKLLRQITNGGIRHAKYGGDSKDLVKSQIIATFSTEKSKFELKAELYLDNIENGDEIKYFELFLKKSENKKWFDLNPDAFDFAQYLLRNVERRTDHPFVSQYLPKDQQLREFVFELTPFLSGIRYYGATIFSDPSKSPVSFELDDNRPARHHNHAGHQRFLYDLYLLKSTDSKAFKRYLNAVNALGVNLVQQIEFSQIEVPNSSVKVRSGGQTEKITSKRTFVVPIFTVDQLQLSPNQLSEGTFKTLALIFYILNDNSKLMLIEEPEVCVHHGLLASVIELIKQESKNKQIIISTHSDYVLDRLRPEDVALVKKTPHGTIIERLSESLSEDDFRALKMYLDRSGNLGEYWKEDGFSFE